MSFFAKQIPKTPHVNSVSFGWKNMSFQSSKAWSLKFGRFVEPETVWFVIWRKHQQLDPREKFRRICQAIQKKESMDWQIDSHSVYFHWWVPISQLATSESIFLDDMWRTTKVKWKRSGLISMNNNIHHLLIAQINQLAESRECLQLLNSTF